MTNNYEQLQEFLNKCIELGWKPRGKPRLPLYIEEDSEGLLVCCSSQTGPRLKNEYDGFDKSIHDLLSIDSGLLEFINWKRQLNDIIITPGYDNKGYINVNKTLSWGMPEYHYMIMGTMTADMKVEYFLQNALLPNKDINATD